MPGSSNNSSFIPKRGTKKQTRKIRNINIYLLTIVSYVLFFAALGASAVAYFYSQNITSELNNEIATMSASVSNFKEADMKRVEEFDVRLRQANHRLNGSASIVSILAGIEEAIIDTLRLSKLSLIRDFDTGYVVEAQAETDSYDSAIFQRNILEGYDVVENVEIRNVALRQLGNETEINTGQTITLVALLAIPLDRVAYEVEPAVKAITETETPPVEELESEAETEATEESTSSEEDTETATDADTTVDNEEGNENGT